MTQEVGKKKGDPTPPYPPRNDDTPASILNAVNTALYSQSSSSLLSSLSSPLSLRDSLGLFGAWLGTPDLAPTTS